MKNLMVIVLLFVSFIGTAKEETKRRVPEYKVIKNEVDPKLSSNQSRFKFEIKNAEVVKSMKISINGVWRTVSVKKQKFDFIVEPGKFALQLLLTNEYYEMEIDSISIQKQYAKTIELNFQSSIHEVITEKPVIYVYGEQEKDITITIQPKGDLTFTYPQTDASWTGKVTSNGFQIDQVTYPYLFWEATQAMNPEQLDWTEASLISKSELMNYLDAATTKIGMNSTEKTDFITYWGPRMAKHENMEVQFVTENVEGLIGDLSVSDKSYTIQRVYLLFRRAEKQESKINLDAIEPIKRPTQLIFEWGGSEIITNDL